MRTRSVLAALHLLAAWLALAALPVAAASMPAVLFAVEAVADDAGRLHFPKQDFRTGVLRVFLAQKSALVVR